MLQVARCCWTSSNEFTRKEDVQFVDQNHFVVVFERVVQVDQLGMAQVRHDADLLAHSFLVQSVRSVDELGRKRVAGRSFGATVNNAERTPTNIFPF